MEIIPYQQIGQFHLGKSMNDLRKEFHGKFSTGVLRNMDYFFDSSIQVEYDENNETSFVGISSPLIAQLNGINLLDLTFKEIRIFLTKIGKIIYHDVSGITCLDLGLCFYASSVGDENKPEQVGIFRRGY